MNHKVLLLALLSFGLLLAALIARNRDLALMALPFLTYLGAGVMGTPSPDSVRLKASRCLNIRSGSGATAIEVHVTVRNEGAGMVPLRLSDPVQPGMKITEGACHRWVSLAAGEEAELAYVFRAERGSFSWQTLHVVASDPLGLFECALELPAGAGLQLRPRMRKLRPIPLRPDSTLHAPGSIPAHLAGSGTDFWGVREYHSGDTLRHLDWRLSARHPRQFFTKEFEQEEIADVGLILDARQRLDIRIGEDSLFEHTLSATASLAEVFLHQGHRVSLFVFGDCMMAVYPGYGKLQLNRILRKLAEVRLGPGNSRLSLEFLPLNMYSSRALMVILSPLGPDDWAIFPHLRAHGNQGLLICPDPFDFARQSFALDPASQLGVRAARVERRLELRKIARLQFRVIDWQVDQPLSPLVQAAFRPARG